MLLRRNGTSDRRFYTRDGFKQYTKDRLFDSAQKHISATGPTLAAIVQRQDGGQCPKLFIQNYCLDQSPRRLKSQTRD